MSVLSSAEKLSVADFAERFRSEMVPLGSKVAYFFAAVPIAEDEVKEFLEEPVAALPPAISRQLPSVSILLVPFLERPNGKLNGNRHAATEYVALERPAENRMAYVARHDVKDGAVLAFAVDGQDMAVYHYRLYHELATLVGEKWNEEAQGQYVALLRDELTGKVNGEVDEESWRLKQALLRRSSNVRRESKAFRDYAQQSFIDTLTLYLHGICCDIDVETGPRQLPSRHMRRRLTLLQSLYPPPKGYAVFPEELSESSK